MDRAHRLTYTMLLSLRYMQVAATPQATPPARQLSEKADYAMVASSCESQNMYAITSESECNVAAALLGLRDTLATVCWACEGVPPACTYSSSTHHLQFNTADTSIADCGGNFHKCVCALPPPPPPPFPPATPPPSPPSPPSPESPPAQPPSPPGLIEYVSEPFSHRSTRIKTALGLLLWLLVWRMNVMHNEEKEQKMMELDKDIERWKGKTTVI